jgi:hypothetical protein
MKKIMVLFLCAGFFACNTEKSTTEVTEEAGTGPAPAEFADAKYADMGKQAFKSLSDGDVAAWISTFADNAVFAWNNGDSLVGKAAINEFWIKRRGTDLDTIYFENSVWLPVRINQPQGIEAPGTWLLVWHKTTAKYNTGKSMTQWVHIDMHFDANDKVDRAIMYLDQVPIRAAMTK